MTQEQHAPEARTFPCINCGRPLDDCDFERRCCDDSDHPYDTFDQMRSAIEARAVAERIWSHVHGPDCDDCIDLALATVRAFAIEVGLAKDADEAVEVVRKVVVAMVDPLAPAGYEPGPG